MTESVLQCRGGVHGAPETGDGAVVAEPELPAYRVRRALARAAPLPASAMLPHRGERHAQGADAARDDRDPVDQVGVLDRQRDEPVEHPGHRCDGDQPVLFVAFEGSDPDEGLIKVVEVATALELSSRSLQRALSSEGERHSDLVDRVRNEEAARLLRDTEFSITEVGYVCGFADSAHFSRSFKKRVGRSPSEYRATARDSQRK